jgi:pheromone shutdown protein TraB
VAKRRKKKKETYTQDDIVYLHNKYRLAIAILVVAFFFVLHHYGVSYKVVKDITGGQVVVKSSESLYGILLVLGKWLGGATAILLGVKTIWDKFIKKKVKENK